MTREQFDRIPQELRDLKQWVTWRLEYPNGMNEKPTKVPYAPFLNQKASVTSPHTWMTYEDALYWYGMGEESGIGFVLTKHDPYVFIDLDDAKGSDEILTRQQMIFSNFDTYSERSPSGTGLHIIGKASVERGRKRSQIEVYSSERFMTMTGNVYADKPINDVHEMTQILWHEMGGPATVHTYGLDADEKEDDATILTRMFEAENGDKARQLYEGDWQAEYPSQSEADQALFNIIAFYTQNRFQIVRIFRSSALGKRDKAARAEYMTYCINKAFDRQLPPIDTEGLTIQFENMLARIKEERSTQPDTGERSSIASIATGQAGLGENGNAPSAAASPTSAIVNVGSSVNIPPGLVGEIAEFIYKAAPRPVAEIALVGALGLVAGIGGRSFNISGTGLNQYLMILAPTGTGKEAINSGVSKLLTAVRANAPSAMDFMGPGEIRSDAALLRHLGNKPVCLSIAGEFGLRMKQMCHERASPHEIGLRKVLLDLYGKSGAGNILHPTAYSDSAKTIPPVNSPNFTMIGESTPQRFYEALDIGMVYEGLLPRFMSFEFTGRRPDLNQAAFDERPSFSLVDRLASFVGIVQSKQTAGQVMNVDGDDNAKRIMSAFNDHCDAEMRKAGQNELLLGFWSRAWLKAMKMAATVAVGINFEMPTVDGPTAAWACDLVYNEVTKMIAKFVNEEIGDAAQFSENKQYERVRSLVWEWMSSEDVEIGLKYGLKPIMQIAKVLPIAAVQRRLASDAVFIKDRVKPSQAIRSVIQQMITAGILSRMNQTQTQAQFSTTAEMYAILDPTAFQPRV